MIIIGASIHKCCYEIREELIDYFFSENLDYKTQGIVIYNEKGERTKIRSANYEKVKHLKNQPLVPLVGTFMQPFLCWTNYLLMQKKG